jgi:hypothetical protein
MDTPLLLSKLFPFDSIPPPPYFLEDNVPDALVFMGFTVYGVSLFFAVGDAVGIELGLPGKAFVEESTKRIAI